MSDTNKPIDEASEIIKAQYERWQINRDTLQGVYAVKPAGKKYLPVPSADTTKDEYESLVAYTNFYPATTRVAQGIRGLLMRKTPALVGTGRLADVKNVITKNGRTIEELTRDCIDECMTTNYGGLWADVPEGTARSALEQKQRNLVPYLSLYSSNSILAVEPAEINFKRVIGRVVLKDDDSSIREVYLNSEGFVEFVKWQKDENENYLPGPATLMLPSGKPITEIPFVPLTDGDDFTPQPAILDHVASLNIQHYRICGLIAHYLMYNSMPMLMATGVEEGTNQQIKMGPGRIHTFPEANSKMEYVVLSGDNLPGLERERDNIADQISIVGSRILAPQKKFAESPESDALRQGAENASLATFAHALSARLQRALQIISDWSGNTSKVKFQINTDYLPLKITTAEADILKDANTRRVLSDRTYRLALRDAGILNENHSNEEEQAWLAEEGIARPDSNSTN